MNEAYQPPVDNEETPVVGERPVGFEQLASPAERFNRTVAEAMYRLSDPMWQEGLHDWPVTGKRGSAPGRVYDNNGRIAFASEEDVTWVHMHDHEIFLVHDENSGYDTTELIVHELDPATNELRTRTVFKSRNERITKQRLSEIKGHWRLACQSSKRESSWLKELDPRSMETLLSFLNGLGNGVESANVREQLSSLTAITGKEKFQITSGLDNRRPSTASSQNGRVMEVIMSSLLNDTNQTYVKDAGAPETHNSDIL